MLFLNFYFKKMPMIDFDKSWSFSKLLCAVQTYRSTAREQFMKRATMKKVHEVQVACIRSRSIVSK